MTDDDLTRRHKRIEEIVAGFPKLNEEKLDRIAGLLRAGKQARRDR
jgi:hypothetical protein